MSSKLSFDLFATCEYAFFSDDKKLNILGIFERIYTEGLPTTQPFMCLVGILNGQAKEKVELEVKLFGPDDKEIGKKQAIRITFGDNGKNNFVIRVPVLTMTKEGSYTFKVYFKNKLIKDIKFYLELKKVIAG